jgi:hypothetical protein
MADRCHIVERIFAKFMRQKPHYHPVLLRRLGSDACDLIIGKERNLENYAQEVESIRSFIEEHQISCVKEIVRGCRLFVPRNISGMYNGVTGIEISLNTRGGLMLFRHTDEGGEYLTKKELFDIYGITNP